MKRRALGGAMFLTGMVGMNLSEMNFIFIGVALVMIGTLTALWGEADKAALPPAIGGFLIIYTGLIYLGTSQLPWDAKAPLSAPLMGIVGIWMVTNHFREKLSDWLPPIIEE